MYHILTMAHIIGGPTPMNHTQFVVYNLGMSLLWMVYASHQMVYTWVWFTVLLWIFCNLVHIPGDIPYKITWVILLKVVPTL